VTGERVDRGLDVRENELRERNRERFSEHGVSDKSFVEEGRRSNTL
jgi:hypothetical protein